MIGGPDVFVSYLPQFAYKPEFYAFNDDKMRHLVELLQEVSEEVTDPLISTKLKNAAWQLNKEV